jgi:cation:H+ antiporter
MPEFESLSLLLNFAVFAVAAAIVWWAGSKLTAHADAIARITGLGQAVVGMLLLGGITSLPEIAVSVTASLRGSAGLAVSNILGGVALQVVIIAIGDALLRDRAITAQVPRPTVLLQAVFSCVLLAMFAAAVLVGDVAVAGVGLWSSAIALTGIGLFWVIARNRDREPWTATPAPELEAQQPQARDETLARAITMTAAMGAVVLVAGWALAGSGEAIAKQSGLGTSFVGAILVGFATSLPEISTVVAAVRIRRYTMAFADIFGTNIFDLMLILLIDAVASGGPVLASQGRFAAFAAVLGIVVTLLYIAGLIERRDRSHLRLGTDSWAVVLAYFGGAIALYTLR